jgi:hypothetical protein
MVNATGLAKMMLDNVLVERVRAEVLFRGEQAQLFARHKPHERSFARTHRAIASHRAIKLAFYFERNLPAVTATLVLHMSSPCAPWRSKLPIFSFRGKIPEGIEKDFSLWVEMTTRTIARLDTPTQFFTLRILHQSACALLRKLDWGR